MTADDEYYDEAMQCMVFEHTEALRDELLALMDLAAEVKAREPDFYWLDIGDWTPMVVRKGIGDKLQGRIEEEGIVYVPGLILPDDCEFRTEYSVMRVDEGLVKWKVGIRHASTEWKSTWFTRAAVIDFLSPVRVIVDRWKEKQRVLQEA